VRGAVSGREVNAKATIRQSDGESRGHGCLADAPFSHGQNHPVAGRRHFLHEFDAAKGEWHDVKGGALKLPNGAVR